MDNSQNSKRLAKNTIFLYLRMFVSMVISLFTSRIILENLGISNYGIYNVIGGLIGMFGLLTATLNVAISRFLTFELGTGNTEKISRVFSSSITIQLIMSLLLLILAETGGLWYVNNVMVIPPDRLVAANFCYQFSIISCILGLIIVPYNASIIAHERMKVFAYMGIFSSLFALLIAYLISISPIDRLIFYGFLLMLSTTITFTVYVCYCKKHFNEARFRFSIDKEMLKSMFGFAGWNYIGAGSAILRDYGGNLLINFYFGPAINAARGLSNSVNTAITQFSNNFTVALNPQIIKSYASGDHEYMFKLIYKGAKMSVFLMLFVAAPVLLNTQFVLSLWLKEVPAQTALFTQLILVYTMIEMISGPLITSMLATGDIKKYQIVVGGINCLGFPLSWLLLHLGCIAETIVIVSIFVAHCCLGARLYMLKGMIHLKAWSFLKNVYFAILAAALIGIMPPLACHLLIADGWVNFLVTCMVCVISMSVSILYIGCNKEERIFLKSHVRKLLKKFIKK